MVKIHNSIKIALGYDETITDKEFIKAWRKKSSQVCKPCWELKYCPYGPFVEQSSLLPSLRIDAIEHNEYLKECLATDTIGNIYKLTDKQIENRKKRLEIARKYPYFLIPEIFKELDDEKLIKEGVEKNLDLFDLYPTPYKNFEKYRMPFPLDESEDEHSKRMLEELETIEITPELKKLIKLKLEYLKQTIRTKTENNRQKLDPVRRKYFEKCVAEFNPDDHPEQIPNEINELSCNIFGHICPVVFVGESITETTEKRRRGRYISFKTKIRVVRRDNYTCQECTKHLKDDEVEFDHIIPISKGGSSEEHNIRLTCFNCNRDKLDKIKI